MKEVAKFVSDTKDLIEKVFLKTSFLIVLVSLFWISQWVNNATAMKYFPFIGRLNALDNYTTYTVTLAMLLLLSRTTCWLWDWIKEGNKFYHDIQIKNLKTQHDKEIQNLKQNIKWLKEDLFVKSILYNAYTGYDIVCEIYPQSPEPTVDSLKYEIYIKDTIQNNMKASFKMTFQECQKYNTSFQDTIKNWIKQIQDCVQYDNNTIHNHPSYKLTHEVLRSLLTRNESFLWKFEMSDEQDKDIPTNIGIFAKLKELIKKFSNKLICKCK